MKLNPIERRVLGVLMEKSMTQPEYYPMTLSAVVAGCNQKSNRDPAMELDEVAVDATLAGLRKRGLVEQLFPAPGGRTDRFRHKVEAVFGWGGRERAIMTELLLRGPQTIGELRTHCSRMIPFENLETVTNVLEALSRLDPPIVAAMPREPGRSAVRYTHLLYPEDEAPSPAGPAAAGPFTSPDKPAAGASPVHGSRSNLHQEVDDLRRQVDELRRRLDQLESNLGG
ncbi:MAG TPA: DUF480 domain-containing protein [Phycisphaerae bacterium]|nr:DUF480 domain-containing protein [Phycisphaerae bacterium]